ncbi:hypothetical protein E4U42_002546 [Claviceps africana]|uniref:Uncharacterized protein n=1 Tax=Claviceps africana TaxID=83212 RepID=A0A8K0J7T4_9HYPO|nr:hypothetical protein E4U42_002546 [Claviceps africana]
MAKGAGHGRLDGRDKINRSRDGSGSDSPATEAAASPCNVAPLQEPEAGTSQESRIPGLTGSPRTEQTEKAIRRFHGAIQTTECRQKKAAQHPLLALLLAPRRANTSDISFNSEKQQDFLCYGQLKLGGRWGCGRRFDWLDDFARHLKTSTGRKCIQPLYDEERQMGARWIGSPNSSQSDDSEYSSFSSFAALSETSTAAHFPEHGVLMPSQLQQFPFDFSCVPLYRDYESRGSSQLQVDMNVDSTCASLGSVDAEPIMTGATVPGISYMAWWQSYMGSTSALNRFGEFASDNL